MPTRLDEALHRLAAIDSTHTPILSIYLSLDPVHKEWMAVQPRLKGLLEPVEELARSGELGHAARKDLKIAIEEAMNLTGPLERPSATGAGLFLGPGIGLRENVDIPARVWDCAIVGPRPYLRPLRAAVDAFHGITAVLVDPRVVEIVSYRTREEVGRERIEAEDLRKSNLAGWFGLDEMRNRQHAEEVRNHLFREVAERLDNMRRDTGVDLVLVGGQHHITQAFLPFLQPGVRARTETFVVDLHTLTPEALRQRVSEMERAFESIEEAREVKEVYSLASQGGLGAVGSDAVFAAASRHAISRLFVNDGTTMEGAVCQRCGSLSGPTECCLTCGGETVEVSDVIDELVRAVTDAAGTVEHVMTETELVTDLVAARLRFELGRRA